MEKRTILDYFLVMFPDLIDEICEWTSLKITGDQVSPHELLKFFGLMVAMTLQPQREHRTYWKETDDCLFPPLCIGARFGMSQDRFEAILGALSFHSPGSDQSDPWVEVRSFVDVIN